MTLSVKVTLLFWMFIVSYIVILTLKIYDILPNGFVRNHVNDLLCIPIVLYIETMALRIIFFNKRLKLSVAKILVTVVVFSLLFEWILPNSYAHHTSDWIDVVCYFIGGFVFWKLAKYF